MTISVEPSGTVYICKTPLENDYKHQLTFANATAQLTYFNSTVVHASTNFTYIRKDNMIKVDAPIDTIKDCNYLFYRNNGFTNKYYFAFISRMEYLSENTTQIYFDTDVWQTYQFDYEFKPCFVAREHVADDTVGLHTVPENVEKGEYEIVDLKNVPLYESDIPATDWWVCFAVTKLFKINGVAVDSLPYETNEIGGVFNGLHFFAVSNFNSARDVIKLYEQQEGITSKEIINVYLIPACCIDGEHPTRIDEGSIHDLFVYPVNTSITEGPFYLQQPQVLAENQHCISQDNAKDTNDDTNLHHILLVDETG